MNLSQSIIKMAEDHPEMKDKIKKLIQEWIYLFGIGADPSVAGEQIGREFIKWVNDVFIAGEDESLLSQGERFADLTSCFDQLSPVEIRELDDFAHGV
jgi:hypothetical protein